MHVSDPPNVSQQARIFPPIQVQRHLKQKVTSLSSDRINRIVPWINPVPWYREYELGTLVQVYAV